MTNVRLKLRMPGWAIPLKRVLQSFKLLTVRYKWTKFSEWVNIRNKQLSFTKIGVPQLRVPQLGCLPQRGPPKLKVLNLYS